MVKKTFKPIYSIFYNDAACNKFCIFLFAWTMLATVIWPRTYMLLDHYPCIECSISEALTSDKRLDEITAPFADRSESEKVAALVGWLEENINYHNGNATDRTWKGVLDTGTGNCRGQAELFYMLATRLGLDCSVLGLELNGEINGHAMCIVRYSDGTVMVADTTAPLLVKYEDYEKLLTETYGGYTVLYPPF